MADHYYVEELLSSDDATKIEHLSSYYPSERAAVQVTSEIAVCGPKDQRYYIRFQQEDHKHRTSKAYALYSSNKLDNSTKGFNRLRDVLDPLLEDCTLFLTEEILLPLVTPTPIDPSQLPSIIAYMKANTAVYPPLWNRVTEVLLLNAISTGNEQAVRVLTMSLSEHIPSVVGPFVRLSSRENAAPDFTTRTALSQGLERGFANVTAALGLKFAAVDPSKAILGLLPYRSKSSSHSTAFQGSSVESNGLTNEIEVANEIEIPTAEFLSIVTSIVNKSSENGTTPLMRSVQMNNLKKAFALLQEGAEVNTRNDQNGYTALHYAVELNGSSLKFVKLLLSYQASMEIKNKDGQTPLQLAKTLSSPAYKLMAEVKDLTDEALKYGREQLSQEVQSADPATSPRDGLYLLALDGGGSRVVISCQILRAIEERMKQLSPTCGSLVSYFDYIAGSSAGGITALSLVHRKVSIGSCLALSLKVIGQSFKTKPPSPTDNSKNIERCLKQHFSDDLKMGEVSQPRVMIMTTLVDRHPPDLLVMCNYGNERNGYHPQKVKVWEVARATSAAPMFFHPFDSKCADGGLMANNPTVAALTELFSDTADGKSIPKINMVISVGTGAAKAKYIQHSSIHVPGGTFSQTLESLVQAVNSVKGLKQLWELFVTQTTRSDGDVISAAKAWCNSIGARYFRLSPILTAELFDSYNTIDEAVLTDLMYEGQLYALREHKTVDQLARCILLRHI